MLGFLLEEKPFLLPKLEFSYNTGWCLGHELSKETILLCDCVTRETPQQKYDTINEVWQEWKVDDRVTIGKGSQIEAVNATFLCIGGVDSYENPTNQLKMLDLRSGEVKTGPSMNEARFEMLLTS